MKLKLIWICQILVRAGARPDGHWLALELEQEQSAPWPSALMNAAWVFPGAEGHTIISIDQY